MVLVPEVLLDFTISISVIQMKFLGELNLLCTVICCRYEIYTAILRKVVGKKHKSARSNPERSLGQN